MRMTNIVPCVFAEAEAGKAPWAHQARKVLSEAPSLTMQFQIWALIVRHATVFITARGNFVLPLVQLMKKLGELSREFHIDESRDHFCLDLSDVVHHSPRQIRAVDGAVHGRSLASRHVSGLGSRV